MRIFISSDHGGFLLKANLKKWLTEQKYSVTDLGPKLLNMFDDFPDYAFPLAEKISKTKNTRGILLCRNAVGMCIAANKVKGIRAMIGFEVNQAKTGRTDDDTNILCLPADFLNLTKAKQIVKIWLSTPFSGIERYERRLEKISRFEKSV